MRGRQCGGEELCDPLEIGAGVGKAVADGLLQSWRWNWGNESGGESEEVKICSWPTCLFPWLKSKTILSTV